MSASAKKPSRNSVGITSQAVESGSSRHSARDAQKRGTGTSFVSAVDQLLFYVILGALCARPLMSESYERIEVSFVPMSGGGPTPATTVLLDSLLLAASAIALARSAFRGRRGAVFAIGLAVLVSAAIISSSVADDKRLAVNASAGFVISVMAGGALARLMSARWMVNIAVSAILATGCVSAWKCIAQVTKEFEETRTVWLEEMQRKAENMDPDDPQLINFERRLASGEAFGYLSHPNNEGECLSMWLLACVGVAIAAMRRRPGGTNAARLPEFLIAGAVSAALAAALWTTHSTGAMVGTAGGFVLLALLGFASAFIARNARRVLLALAIAYVAVIAFVAVYGVVRGSLPHPSLAFRWHYWSAAGRAWLDAPLTGVGRENFDAAYLLHKPGESPEEVKNPHNLWVSLLVELGPLGLVAVVVILGAWCARVLCGLNPTIDLGAVHVPASEGIDGPPGALLSLEHARLSEAYGPRSQRTTAVYRPPLSSRPAAILSMVVATALFSRSEYLHSGLSPLILIWLVEIALLWAVSFLALSHVLREPLSNQRARSWLTAALAASVMGALVHNLVGFSLMTPAGLAVAAVLAASAAALAESTGVSDVAPVAGSARSVFATRRGPALILAAIAITAQFFLVTLPTVRTEIAVTRMRRGLSVAISATDAGNAVVAAEDAVAADRLESSAARDVAVAALQISMSDGIPPDHRLRWQQRAEQSAQIAVRRSPKSVSNWRLLAEVSAALAESLQNANRRDQAVESYRGAARYRAKAVELNPTSTRIRKAAGETWFVVWQQTGDGDAADRALAEFEVALNINSKYPPEEVIRLTKKELAEIEAHVVQLRRAK